MVAKNDHARLRTVGRITHGKGIGRIASLASTSAICLMVSIINDGVTQSDGSVDGVHLGASAVSLYRRYISLLLQHALEGRILTGMALMSAFAAFVLSLKQVLGVPGDGDSFKKRSASPPPSSLKAVTPNTVGSKAPRRNVSFDSLSKLA